MNLVLALAPLVPQVNDWIVTYPVEAMSILAILNILLRLITKDKLVLFPLLLVFFFLPGCVAMGQPSVAFSYVLEDGSSVSVNFNKLAPKASDKNPIAGK